MDTHGCIPADRRVPEGLGRSAQPANAAVGWFILHGALTVCLTLLGTGATQRASPRVQGLQGRRRTSDRTMTGQEASLRGQGRHGQGTLTASQPEL